MATQFTPVNQLTCPRGTEADHGSKTTMRGRCFLLELSGDVRNILYRFTFYEPTGIHVNFSHNPIRQTSLAAMTLTCKQVYYETRDLSKWLNAVHLHVPLLQDLSLLRADNVLPMTQPSARREQSPRRDVRFLSGNLATKSLALREQAEKSLMLATRPPHMDATMRHFTSFAARRHLISSMRSIHVHLGSQVRNTFAGRFNTAWDAIAPTLFELSARVDLRVLFTLRVSKRLVIDYDFTLRDLRSTLEEMDACVQLGDIDLSLPELATINDIRTRVWQAFSPADNPNFTPAPFPSQVDQLVGMAHQTAEVMRKVSLGATARV